MRKLLIAKAIIFVLFIFYFSKISTAQVYSNTPSSTASFTIGLTASDLIKDTINYSTGILFNAGFVYNLKLSKKMNAAVELLYTGKSMKTDNPIVKYRYFYADIPLYLQYNFNENMRANIGGQYSIFANSIVSQIDGAGANGVNNQKYKNIKNTDYGVLFGAEIDLSEKLTLTGRYTLSTSTFFENNKTNFGVFNLAFKIAIHSTYKQFFSKKEVIQ